MADRCGHGVRVFVSAALVAALTLVLAAALRADVSTAADRAALFDDLLAKILRREAFSPVKNRLLGLDVERAIARLRDEVIAATTDEDLFYALVKVSNARRDRHLSVSTVVGGLVVPGILPDTEDDETPAPLHAPVRLAVDYGTRQRFLFVADRAAVAAPSAPPGLGDKVVGVNGRDIDDYLADIAAYHRSSTTDGLWDKLALWLPQRARFVPPRFYQRTLSLGLERPDGEHYTVDLPYAPPASLVWENHGARRYPGFDAVFATPTFDLHRHAAKQVLLLSWHGFGPSLTTDVDRLMAHAERSAWLDHDIIFDGTRSGGGSRGPYAIQRLQSRPFKTTFGNLRLSDTTEPFIARVRERVARREVTDGGSAETMDGGRWLLEWLEDDVSKGLRAGQAYSNAVPFKLAHLPKWSDGILQPAPVHFRGRLVCLFGPFGGSHLDQFAAIVVDNGLGHAIGMPTGGYSNTWEWEETLRFPLSGRPAVRFMWNIGHTIRPNGQILEGEAARVHDLVLQTRDNFAAYYPTLIARAMRHLGHE